MYSCVKALEQANWNAGHTADKMSNAWGQHLQVIDRNVGRFGIQGAVEGLTPQVFGQVGKAGDEVQAPRGRRGRMHGLQRFVRVVQRVRPPTDLQQLLAHMQDELANSAMSPVNSYLEA